MGFNTSIATHHEKRQIVAVEDTYFETSNPDNMSVGQGGTATNAKAITSIGSTYSGNLVRSLHYKDELDVDYTRDFLIGKLDFAGNFRNFCTLDPDIARPRALILDSNIAALNYDGDTTPVLQTTYSDVTLSGIAIDLKLQNSKSKETLYPAVHTQLILIFKLFLMLLQEYLQNNYWGLLQTLRKCRHIMPPR